MDQKVKNLLDILPPDYESVTVQLPYALLG